MALRPLENATVSVVSAHTDWLRLDPPDGVAAPPLFLRRDVIFGVRPTYEDGGSDTPVETGSELWIEGGQVITTIHTPAELVAIVETP